MNIKAIVLGVICLGASGAAEAALSSKMGELQGELKKILSGEIGKDQVARIKRLAHDLKAEVAQYPDKDPTLGLISNLFSSEAESIASIWDSGSKEYAKSRLKNLTSYCMACHTRSQGATTHVPLTPPSGLSGIAKAEFFASTRQFKEALAEYTKKMGGAEWSLDLERAARSALAIAVRVENDPKLAAEIIDRLAGTKNLPQYLLTQVSAWQKSIAAWKSESKREAVTVGGLRAEMLRLFDQARGVQEFPHDRSADVLYLRATAVAHKLMGQLSPGPALAEASYFMGVSYEALRGLHLWEIHDLYYLGCINSAPHSEIAQKCFARYEESTIEGFSGSGGMHLPPSLKQRLKTLNDLASPLEVKKPK